MGHGTDDRPSRARLDPATAKSVAATLQALATPSRLLILANLQEGPMTVSRALRREHQLKQLTRPQKEAFVRGELVVVLPRRRKPRK